MRLENQDVILVPPPGPEVILKGQLHRPAKYELRPDEGLRRLLEIAGGLVPESYAELVQIGADYAAGRLLTGEVKQKLIETLLPIVETHQRNRAAVTDAKAKSVLAVCFITASL